MAQNQQAERTRTALARFVAAALAAVRASVPSTSATLHKRPGGGYRMSATTEPPLARRADDARQAAVAAAAALADALRHLADDAARAGFGDLFRLREGCAWAENWQDDHAPVGTLPTFDRGEVRRAHLLGLVVDAAGDAVAAPKIDPAAMELAGGAFARAALELLADVGGARDLEAFEPIRLAQRLGEDYPRKTLGRMVRCGLVERAGNGESKRGAWRITDHGRQVLDAIKRRP